LPTVTAGPNFSRLAVEVRAQSRGWGQPDESVYINGTCTAANLSSLRTASLLLWICKAGTRYLPLSDLGNTWRS
ncbi:MAG: hypothetical protein LR015_11060, partial [Verrucomicrobia bacterium]|nr:hypothetical protein [Verrucomicrobiota bacterium]